MAEVHAGAKFEILKDAERCRTIRAGLARHQLSDSPYLENRLTKFVARRARLCLGTRRYFSADASGFRRHFFWQRAQSFSHLRARHPVRRSRLTLLVARRRLTLCMAAVVSAMGAGAPRRHLDSYRRRALRRFDSNLRLFPGFLDFCYDARVLRRGGHHQFNSSIDD